MLVADPATANFYAILCPANWTCALPRTKNLSRKFALLWHHLSTNVSREELLNAVQHVPEGHIIVALRKGGRKQYLCVTPRCQDRLARSYAGGPSLHDDDSEDDGSCHALEAADEGDEQDRSMTLQFQDYLQLEWQPPRCKRKRRRERVSFKRYTYVHYESMADLERAWRQQQAATFAQQCKELGERQQAERDMWLAQLEQQALADDSDGVLLPGDASADGTGPCWAPDSTSGLNAVGLIVTKLRELYLKSRVHRCTEKVVPQLV